jgi:hypothetical protein
MKKLVLFFAALLCLGYVIRAQVMIDNVFTARHPSNTVNESDIGNNRTIISAISVTDYENEAQAYYYEGDKPLIDNDNCGHLVLSSKPFYKTELIDEMSEFYSSQQWWTRSNFPSNEITEGWNAGRQITDLSYGNGAWALVMSGSTGYYSQCWWTRDYFPSNEIQQGWDAAKRITEITYGNGVWALVMSKGTGYSSQLWRTRSSFPSAEIQEGWNAGKDITNLSYGNGVWALVMSGSTGYSLQQWWTRSSFPSNEITEGWNAGKDITNISYGNGSWALVMSKGTGYTSQLWWTRSSFPSNEITEGWNAGFDITNLTYGNGVWVLVMSKMAPNGVNNNLNNLISIFPNPVKDKVKINGLSGKSELLFYNLNGELTKQQSINNEEVNLSDLPSGIYLLTILSDGNILTTQRIIKM